MDDGIDDSKRIDDSKLLTKDEQAVLDMLAKAWDRFSGLKPIGKGVWDQPEFMCAIHAAQRIVLSRPAMRHIWESDD